ncbi:hypothetical protein ACA910_017817 [Epithemia clementina (nom. ined.)]
MKPRQPCDLISRNNNKSLFMVDHCRTPVRQKPFSFLIVAIIEVILLLILVQDVVTATADTTTSQQAANGVPPPPYRHCVVVGGGPVGLAAALTLSNPPHSYNVTVLEQQGSREQCVQRYDPATHVYYLYQLNPRGLEWVQQQRQYSLTLVPRLSELGTPSSKRYSGAGKPRRTRQFPMVIIPANPNEPIDWSQVQNNTTTTENVTATAEDSSMNDTNHSSIQLDNANKQEDEEEEVFDLQSWSVWITRPKLVQALLEACEQQQQQQQDQAQSLHQSSEPDEKTTPWPKAGSIQVLYGKQVVQIRECKATPL